MLYYIFAVGIGYKYELIASSSTLPKAKGFMSRYQKDHPEYVGRLGIYKRVE